MREHLPDCDALGLGPDLAPSTKPCNCGAVHISTCAQLEKRPCWNGLVEHGSTVHRWSGWPGAHCLTCFMEDKDEVCLALSCACPCHDKFWADYAADCLRLEAERGKEEFDV